MQTDWKGPKINQDNWTDIISSQINDIDWKKAKEDTVPFLEREAEKYLLTRDNCLNLLKKFHNK